MMTRKILALAVAAIMSTSLNAQNWFGVSYSTSYPIGDFKEYMPTSSFRGISFEYKSYLTENFLVGFNNGYNFFNDQIERKTYTIDNLSINGVQQRHTTGIPIMATAGYSGPHSGKLRWYAGVGIGTTYIYRYTEFGMYTFSRETWQFLIAPEVGVWVPLVQENVIYMTARYHLNFENDEMLGQQYISLNLGWAWGWGKDLE